MVKSLWLAEAYKHRPVGNNGCVFSRNTELWWWTSVLCLGGLSGYKCYLVQSKLSQAPEIWDSDQNAPHFSHYKEKSKKECVK